MDDHKKIIWTIPNGLTLLRFVFIGLAYFLGKEGRWELVLLLVALAAITDFFDGDLARKMKCKSTYGAALDPIADKTFVVVIVFLLDPYLAVSILIAELIGMFFSNYVRKVAGGHYIAHGSKGITFIQMTIVIILIINKIDLSNIFLVLFFSNLSLLFNLFVFLKQLGLGLLWLILGLSTARMLIYGSLYSQAKKRV